jgi:hypothetical protein
VELAQLVSNNDEDNGNINVQLDGQDETNWCQPVGSQYDLNAPTTQEKNTPNSVEDEED